MKWYYSEEKNVQILISLLKKYNIHRAIVSPGSTNACFAASLQGDDYFTLYSCVDERSAAYMACGMSVETNEPVVLSCTGATASRNYMSAMTEAYYRKIPIIAVTSSQLNQNMGNLYPQLTDRTKLPSDVAMMSVQVPYVQNRQDFWFCSLQINKALSEACNLSRGPVHINLETNYSRNFNNKELPQTNMIKLINYDDDFPVLPNCSIVISIGSHMRFNDEEIHLIDQFCEINNAVVFYEISSGYSGKYGIKYDLIAAQKFSSSPLKEIGLMIQLGEMAGADFYRELHPQKVWRVNRDGKMKDTFRHLECVFYMGEKTFFLHYNNNSQVKNLQLYNSYKDSLNILFDKLRNANLPFSNIWMAQQSIEKLPAKSELHLGIMNSFRAWNLFYLPNDVEGYCNVGGYGIDGCVSSMVGASIINPRKIFIGVFGDLAFFYDMNVLGNHHINNNIRILLVNNGKGNEFHNPGQNWAKFGEYVDLFGAAGGHFGSKSKSLVRHFAEDLGFEYITASDKESFLNSLDYFMSTELTQKPLLFEVFTNGEDDSEAYSIIRTLDIDLDKKLKEELKDKIRSSFGDFRSRQIADILDM